LGRITCLGSTLPPAAHGLAAQGFFAAQGFLAAQGFFAAQGFLAFGAHGLHGLAAKAWGAPSAKVITPTATSDLTMGLSGEYITDSF
jgi:hypothetical protein